MFDSRVFSEEMCARAFDLGTPKADFVFAGRGQTNPLGILRLETDKGVFAIKRSKVPPQRAALAVEQAAFTAGVPMPRPLQTTSGDLAASYTTSSSRVWVRAYSWIDGESGDWGQVSESAAFDVGQLIARVHALPVAADALVEERWQPPDEAAWRSLAQLASARRQAWADLLFQKIPLLLEAGLQQTSSLSERISPSQSDYHPPNVITPPFGPRVLVDWDAAGPAVARIDVFKFALIWATPDNESPVRELVHAFIRGYHDAGCLLDPPTVPNLVRLAQPNVWWIWFNVQRDLSADPGPDPELVPALLSGVEPIDIENLKASAQLFR